MLTQAWGGQTGNGWVVMANGEMLGFAGSAQPTGLRVERYIVVLIVFEVILTLYEMW